MFTSSTPNSLWQPTAGYQNTEENVLIVYLPQPTMKVSPQALRSHTYAPNDRLVNDIVRIADSTATGGIGNCIDGIVKTKHARDAITLSTSVDGVFDVNRFNECWRFVLTLNTFPNRMISLNKHTVVITGIFREEPFNAATKAINENAIMEIQSKQVITRQQILVPGGTSQGLQNTAVDQIFLNMGDLTSSNLTGTQLSQNTIGAFDFSNIQHPTSANQKPQFLSAPMYGSQEASNFSSGPLALQRFNALPRTALSNVINAVSNAASERQAARLGGQLGYNSAFDGDDVFYPEKDLGAISSYLKSREQVVHTLPNLGPAQNEIVTMRDLKVKWNVQHLYSFKLQDSTFFTGEDQTVLSTRTMYCSLLSSLIPIFASNTQLSDLSFVCYIRRGDYGEWEHDVHWDYVESTTPNVSTAEKAAKLKTFFTELKMTVLDRIMEEAGDYHLQVEYHHYGKSQLSLRLMGEALGVGQDNVWEFFPNHSTFTTPMMGSFDRVQNNQNVTGQMFYDIASQLGMDKNPISGGHELFNPNPTGGFDSQAGYGSLVNQFGAPTTPSQPMTPPSPGPYTTHQPQAPTVPSPGQRSFDPFNPN